MAAQQASFHLDSKKQILKDVPGRMAGFRRIAACVDLSNYAPCVISHARVVASALGTPLTLIHVVEEGGGVMAGPPDPVSWDIRRREARDAMALLAEAGEEGDSADAAMIEGRAAEQISLWTRHHDIDLTVLGSHGAGGVTEWGLGSTAQKVIDWSHGSLLLVPSAGVPECVTGYRRILVLLDGSPHAESVLPLAVRLAREEGAGLVLAHAVPIPELTETGPVEEEARFLKARLIERNEAAGQNYLDQLRDRIGSGIKVETRLVKRGDVRSTLLHLIVDEQPDLVIMAAHGRGRRSDIAFGSVASYLIAHARVPMLIVRRGATHLAHRCPAAPLSQGQFRPSVSV